ncbi:glycosyltransferase family 39 protein [Streptomyces sp. NPDC047108]|uniref:glycosyltransferase family 39 protein n=1 Tax=Streptomyces sp. NPDC047108 TaxID=3155025 RepID=UPI0033D98859
MPLVRRARIVALPVVVALALGLWGIRREGTMWRDESVTYQMAHRGLSELWATLGNVDAVHGLYYLLMHGWFAVWDGGLLALRLPSLLAMAAAAGAVAWLGQHLVGRRAGVFAGLVLAVLPPVQMYAQEGRSYALVCAAVATSTCLFLRAVGTPGGRRSVTGWTAYAVVTWVACLLHEFAILALLAHGATLYISRRRVGRGTRRAWTVAASAVTAGVLPLVVVSTGQQEQLSWLGRPSWSHWTWYAAVLTWAALCRVPVRGRGPVGPWALAMPLLALPAALLMTASLVTPLYLDRYVLYSAIGFALITGTALDRLLRPGHLRQLMPSDGLRYATVALVVAGASALLIPSHLKVREPGSRKDDVTGVALAVQASAEPGDAILFMPSRRREWRLSYAPRYGKVRDIALDREPVASHSLHGSELPAREIRARMLAERRIVTASDPAGAALDTVEREVVKRAVLREHFAVCSRTEVRGGRVTVWAREGHCAKAADSG